MPLETATTIDGLNTSNPAHSDGLAQADSHLRLLKSTLKTTFPNINSPVASTAAQIDAAAGLGTNGAPVLADGGVSFKTNTGSGITDVSDTEMDFKVGGSAVAKLKSDLSMEVTGALKGASVNSVGAFTGGTGQLTPTGATLLWWTDTLPSGFAWCNGALLNRTTYAALFTLFGTSFGAGDSVTTFGIPDLRETVPIGKSTMGGVAARGLISHLTLTTLNSVVGEGTHTLTEAELPAISRATDAQGGHSHTFGYELPAAREAGGNGSVMSINTTGSYTVTTSAVAAHTHTLSFGSGQAHNVVQKSTVCNWIIKT